MANPTNKYVTELGLQQPSASDLTDGTTGSGTVVLSVSPALTSAPTAPTQSAADNSTKIATTAFVQTAISGIAAGGGVNAQTANYLAVAGDSGKLISMNGSTLTLTLPNPSPSSTWWIAVENVNASNLTISRNSLNIDGAAANLTLTQNQGVLIYTDGTNYFTSRGLGTAGGSITLQTNGINNGSQTLLNLIGGTNVTITDNGSGGITIASTGGGGAGGGVNSQTASYLAVSGDSGKLITFKGSAILTLTLPASPPSSSWWIAVENVGTYGLIINRNSLNIDGAAANLNLTPGQGLFIYTDGTNYFSDRGGPPNGGLYNSPDNYPSAAGTLDDEFDGSTLNTSTRWTWVNQGTAVPTVTGSRLQIAYSGAATNLQIIYQTAPSTPWEVTTGPLYVNAASSGTIGIALRSATGQFVIFCQFLASATATDALIGYWTSATAFSSNPTNTVYSADRLRYLKVKDDGTNLTFSASADGVVFWQVNQLSRTAFLTGGPTGVGLVVQGTTPTSNAGYTVDWFRRTL